MIVIDNIENLRSFVAADRDLIEPVADANGIVHWTASSTQTAWINYEGVPLSSLKPYFFAERETVFVFDGTQFCSQLPQVPARVFFGIKACDAAALAIQDRFFAEDEFYQARRQQALVVAVDCIAPCKGGFCPLTQAGPLVQAGADLVITPLNENWLVQGMTAKGAALLAEFSASCETRSIVNAEAMRQELGVSCTSAFGDLDILANGIAKLQAGSVPENTWETLAIQCLACSGCVNLCPSCTCFTTFDVSHAANTVRERVWDACLYEGFQREASGHHPSPTPGARTARYWFHKFSPEFIPQQGRLGCTGCGRCDAVCPGVIGAKAVLTRIATC